MKEVVRKIFLIIFSCLLGACVFSACSGGGNTGNTDGGNTGGADSAVKDYGLWSEYNGVRLAYVSEKDAPNGNVDENRVVPELACETDEIYYMVADFEIQAYEDNDGQSIVDATVKIEPTTVISARLQETNSANYTDDIKDGVQQIAVKYKIPDKADVIRKIRLIIKLETLQSSEAYIGLTFASQAESVGGVQTNTIEQTASIGFTKGLTYRLTEGGNEQAYEVTGLEKSFVGKLTVPLFKDRLPVKAIGSSVVCGGEYTEYKSLQDTGRTFFLDGNLLLNEAKSEVVFGCGTGDLPDSVTSISGRAYAGCEELTKFSVPERITKIGEGAFCKCDNIASFELLFPSASERPFGYFFGNELPASLKKVSVLGTSVPDNAFRGCNTIETITLSEKITGIGSSAFYGCSSLSSINLSGKLTSIGDWAFYNCAGLKSVNIPGTVENVDGYAFRGCTGITAVTLPDNIKQLGAGAFTDCAALNKVTLPGRITKIAENTFSGCAALSSIKIPNTVKTIGERAFYNCKSIVSLLVPDGVTTIEREAFSGCLSITEVTLPYSLMKIGSSAFRNSVYGKIIYKGTKANWTMIMKESEWNVGTFYTVYCTDGTREKWQDDNFTWN